MNATEIRKKFDSLPKEECNTIFKTYPGELTEEDHFEWCCHRLALATVGIPYRDLQSDEEIEQIEGIVDTYVNS